MDLITPFTGDFMTPSLEFISSPLKFVVVMPEDAISASRRIRVSFACRRRCCGRGEPCIKSVGWRCDKKKARVIDAEESRRECWEDLRGKVFNPTMILIDSVSAIGGEGLLTLRC